MESIYTPNKTSAKLLIDFAKKRWNSAESTPDEQKRYLIIYDLYIKARSYSLINKFSFWLAIFSSIMVVVWPSLATVSKEFGFEKDFLSSAIVQTAVTGLAALTYAVYSHYKKRQMYMENLMRRIIYLDETFESLTEHVLSEMERIDGGFSFSEGTLKKDKTADDKPDR